MSKTLSQWEIDALLNSIGNDDSTAPGARSAVGVLPSLAERSIKLYDFRRPDRFSKEHHHDSEETDHKEHLPESHGLPCPVFPWMRWPAVRPDTGPRIRRAG